MLDEFEKHLQRENLSQNTISAYLLSVRMYEQLGGEITKRNLLAFKGYLTPNPIYSASLLPLTTLSCNGLRKNAKKKYANCFKNAELI